VLLVLFIAAALCVISLITISNVIFFPRLKPKESKQTPLVSVMIPARNEADKIDETIKHLLNQTYDDYEIILLDDNSTDDTEAVAREAAEGSERLQIIKGQALPNGWLGKNWACHQIAQVANGEILIFTDADVHWQPEALISVIAEMERTDADLLTVWPTQTTVTWGERLCVPLMAVVVIGYLPILATHYVSLSIFGAANGQCMIWRREAYRKIGGHAAVRDNVLEDVTMGRMVKAMGMRLRMADGNRLIGCRMYENWRAVRDGYAKNILAGYGGWVATLLLATVFHWLIFLFPLVWLLFGRDWSALSGWPAVPLSFVVMGFSVRALSALFTHQRVWDTIALPISVIFMTRIALQAIYWHYRGGTQWKGRTITSKPTRKQASHG